jgi:DNA-directed RNA polymerase subunit RPC12/RpoP
MLMAKPDFNIFKGNLYACRNPSFKRLSKGRVKKRLKRKIV